MFKQKNDVQIRDQLTEFEIRTYDFPASELPPEVAWMRERMPFAVVASNTFIEVRKLFFRGQKELLSVQLTLFRCQLTLF
jgi:septin family protein